MSRIWFLWDSLQHVNFITILLLEIAGIVVLGPILCRSIGSQKKYWWLLTGIIIAMSGWRSFRGGTGSRRYFVALVVPFLCFAPVLFFQVHRLVKTARIRVLLIAILLTSTVGIAFCRALRQEEMPWVVREFSEVLRKEYQNRPPAGKTVVLHGNTERERQILYYAGLSIQLEWLPDRNSKQWTSARFLREYHYFHKKALPPQMDIYLLLRGQAQDDMDATLAFFTERRQFKLLACYQSQQDPDYWFYHLQRDIISEYRN